MNTRIQKPWYKQSWFAQSNWVSTFTRWLVTFGGKLARIVLIAATLYMSAELYPGVKFPDGLNLAVFIILSFALDMGGLGLAQIAKQARIAGNVEGAEKGERLSKWLIRIMIAGLITVSVEHMISTVISNSTTLPAWVSVVNQIVQGIIDLVLIIARAICAVKYGHVLSDLEATIDAPDETQFDHVALSAQVNSLVASLSQLQETVSQFPDVEARIQSFKAEIDATFKTMKWDMSHPEMRQETMSHPDVTPPLARALEEDGTDVLQEEEWDTEQSTMGQESATKGTVTVHDIQQYILSHPGATQQEMADFFGVTRRTIQRKMSSEKELSGTGVPLRIVK